MKTFLLNLSIRDRVWSWLFLLENAVPDTWSLLLTLQFVSINLCLLLGTSIEAMLAQKRKEKMMAKKQQQADTRNKRMAFKEKLEAQSPKVYVINYCD